MLKKDGKYIITDPNTIALPYGTTKKPVQIMLGKFKVTQPVKLLELCKQNYRESNLRGPHYGIPSLISINNYTSKREKGIVYYYQNPFKKFKEDICEYYERELSFENPISVSLFLCLLKEFDEKLYSSFVNTNTIADFKNNGILKIDGCFHKVWSDCALKFFNPNEESEKFFKQKEESEKFFKKKQESERLIQDLKLFHYALTEGYITYSEIQQYEPQDISLSDEIVRNVALNQEMLSDILEKQHQKNK